MGYAQEPGFHGALSLEIGGVFLSLNLRCSFFFFSCFIAERIQSRMPLEKIVQ